MPNLANREKHRVLTYATAAGVFVTHQFVCTWGAIAAATELTTLYVYVSGVLGHPFPINFSHWLLTETPYFPVQIALALILGWLLSYSTRCKAMLWVWILPLVILCYALFAVPTIFPALTAQVPQPPQSPFSHYFGWGCQPQNHCIDQTVVTLPFYTSVAYSLGALVAQKISRGFRLAALSRYWVSLLLGLAVLAAVAADVALSYKVGARWEFFFLAVIPAAIAAFLIRNAFKARQVAA